MGDPARQQAAGGPAHWHAWHMTCPSNEAARVKVDRQGVEAFEGHSGRGTILGGLTETDSANGARAAAVGSLGSVELRYYKDGF